ncbi:MAG TPA: hypothetical protein VH857_13355 [Actinomycetes bacterium]|jgi:hypothetical protein|nr:hypothetical protein [Actinomycetes bacterium]
MSENPDSVADRDREIEETDEARSSAARLFDIRRVIGGLFTLYGVLVLVAGIVDGSAASKKAAGIDINLWTGMAMLAFGLLMLLWLVLRPSPPVPVQHDDDGRAGHE